jgi:hypothetical protein
MKRMFFILALAFLSQACSTIELHPTAKTDNIYQNKNDKRSVMIVAPIPFQQYVATGGLITGDFYKNRNVRVHLGEPLTESIYKKLSAVISDVKIGDALGKDKTKITITPALPKLQLHVGSDANIDTLWNGVFVFSGAISAGMNDVVSAAKITMDVEILDGDLAPKKITITGKGIESVGYYSFRERHMALSIEKAIADLTANLAAELSLIL